MPDHALPTSTEPDDRATAGGGKRRLAPLAAALLLVAVVGGTTLAVRTGGPPRSTAGSGGPPVLHLWSAGAGAAHQAALPPGAAAGPYLLTGSLPTGRPGTAPIYRFAGGRAPVDVVRRLAAALGLAGVPKREGAGWRLVSGGRELTVQDAPGWVWQLDYPVRRVQPQLVCVRAPCPGSPAADGPVDQVRGLHSPTPAGARRTASSVLRALGLPAADLRADVYAGTVQVRAPRRVAGGQVLGMDTTVEVGGDYRVASGGGFLGTPRAGPSYPVVPAAEAFRRLQAQQPRKLGVLCRVGCPLPGPLTVTGARLGRVVSGDAHGAVLVPAWLFTVTGAQQPAAVVAVESRYLGPPPPPGPPGPPVTASTGMVDGSPVDPPVK